MSLKNSSNILLFVLKGGTKALCMGVQISSGPIANFSMGPPAPPSSQYLCIKHSQAMYNTKCNGLDFLYFFIENEKNII